MEITMRKAGNISRRNFMKKMVIGGGSLLLAKDIISNSTEKLLESNGFTLIHVAQNGTAYQNIDKIMYMMGGIQNIINKDDIVVIKPNCQWHN